MKNTNNIRKHIIMSKDLDDKIWKINGPSKNLIEKGIDNLILNENISFTNSMLEKIYAREGYTIDLIEQMWRELDMKDKLENFKKNRFKDSKYVK